MENYVSNIHAGPIYDYIGPAYQRCCYHKIVWIYEHEHDKKKEKEMK
jgi:hypothetical protein